MPCDELITRPRSPTICEKWLRNWIRGLGPEWAGRAIEKIWLYIIYTHSLTHGAEPFLRSHQVCSHSRTSRVLWNPKVHYRVHKSSPLVPILSQIDPIHTIPSYLSKNHFNMVTHLRLGLPSGLFPSVFPTNILYVFLFSQICVTCPVHLIINLLILTIPGEEYNLWSSPL
jgi:hypothetical protein